jgi:flagellar motor switch protein FliM
MSKILSQEEIDTLLTSAPDLHQAAREQATEHDDVQVYNFRRPDRVSKEQIRSLHFLHDRFARNVATSLSAYLRTVTHVSVTSVEQFTYTEFLAALPDPTAFYAVAMPPLEGLAALELNPSVAFVMIDRMLGGSGRGLTPSRGLTEIEQHVIDGVVKVVLDDLAETWKSIAAVRFRISSRDTRPQMLQVAAPNEVVVLVAFEIRIGEAGGMLNICLPSSSIESVGESFTHSWYRAHRTPSTTEREEMGTALGRLPMHVAATVETTLTARDVLALQPGDVINLGHRLAEPIQGRVNNLTKFFVIPTLVDGRAGVRVESLQRRARQEREGAHG